MSERLLDTKVDEMAFLGKVEFNKMLCVTFGGKKLLEMLRRVA
jgi:hypothetical protein